MQISVPNAHGTRDIVELIVPDSDHEYGHDERGLGGARGATVVECSRQPSIGWLLRAME